MRRSLVLAVLIVGCSNAPTTMQTEELPELKSILEPQPANGYQVVLPIVKNLAPGSDTEMCTWTSLIFTKTTDVRSVEAYQTKGGHHIVMYTTDMHVPPGTTRACTDQDMATFRFGAGAGAEGMGSKNTAPGNLVYRIPAGAQVVLNHHYINATPNMLDSQSAINVWLADPGKTYVPVGSMAILDTSMHLPSGSSTLDINCTLPHTVNVWNLIPHMHAYGTRTTIEKISGSTVDQLVHVDPWSPAYMFHPPAIVVDPAQAIVFNQGDQIHVRCEWDNTLGHTIGFGIEMCVGYVEFVDNDNLGNLQCDHGQWGTF